MSLRIVGWDRHHDRVDFDCGDPALNGYLRRLARQQAQRDFSRTYVAEKLSETSEASDDAEHTTRRIKGFYAISSDSIDFTNLPDALNLPRYPVPVARMGRLEVDFREQGHGVGAALLAHAMQLSATLARQIGLYALPGEGEIAARRAGWKQEE